MKIIIIYIYNLYYICNFVILFHSRILINDKIKFNGNKIINIQSFKNIKELVYNKWYNKFYSKKENFLLLSYSYSKN